MKPKQLLARSIKYGFWSLLYMILLGFLVGMGFATWHRWDYAFLSAGGGIFAGWLFSKCLDLADWVRRNS